MLTVGNLGVGIWRIGTGELRLARVLDATVRGKLLVSLRFKVPHHRVKILPGRQRFYLLGELGAVQVNVRWTEISFRDRVAWRVSAAKI